MWEDDPNDGAGRGRSHQCGRNMKDVRQDLCQHSVLSKPGHLPDHPQEERKFCLPSFPRLIWLGMSEARTSPLQTGKPGWRGLISIKASWHLKAGG